MQKLLENELYNVRLYNNRLLARQMRVLDKTPEQLALEAGVSESSVINGLKGSLGTLRTLRQIADVLKIKWEYITHVDLPESQFHRAVVRAGKLDEDGAVKKGG